MVDSTLVDATPRQMASRSAQLARPKSWSRSHFRSIGRLNENGAQPSRLEQPIPSRDTMDTDTSAGTSTFSASQLKNPPKKENSLRSLLKPMGISFSSTVTSDNENIASGPLRITDSRYKIEDEKKMNEREKIIMNYFGNESPTKKSNIIPNKQKERKNKKSNRSSSRSLRSRGAERDSHLNKDYSVPFVGIVNNESDVTNEVYVPQIDKVDRFGFLLEFSEGHHVSNDSNYRESKKEMDSKTSKQNSAEREQKWAKMLQNWDRTKSSKKEKLKRRVRKGIPNSLRGVAWTLLGDVPDKIKGEKKGSYEKILIQALEQQGDQPLETGEVAQENNGVSSSGEVFKETIERDINRTFPTHQLFFHDKSLLKINDQSHKPKSEIIKKTPSQESNRSFLESSIALNVRNKIYGTELDTQEISGEESVEVKSNIGNDDEPDLIHARGGQASLRRVLRAYSVIDPEVGYCQGMNFISAMFIIFMSEEEAFWLLEKVMNQPPCKMRGLFGSGMAEAREVLFIAEKLISQFLPKLASHLEKENIHITMYATQWLLTLYSSTFPFDLVTRIWDCFLLEGWKIAYRVMLAILALSEQHLLGMKFEEVLGYLKEVSNKWHSERIMQAAFSIPLKTKHLEKWKKEYDSNVTDLK